MSAISENARHTIDAGVDLLDRQLIDKDGLMAGKVDNLEFTPVEGSGPPVLTGILAGPGALAPRLGRTARAVGSLRLRLAGTGQPSRVAFGVVRTIQADVRLAVSRDELDSIRSERWAGRAVERIPGAE